MEETKNNVQVAADLAEGFILGNVQLAAPPERVFRALASDEIIQWWVRPGVFDTREWTGDARVGGHWKSSGVFRGMPYALEGEYLIAESPKKLAHTYGVGAPWGPTTVTYLLEPIEGGTRLTLRHSGFTTREACEGNQLGWQTSLARLTEIVNQ